MRAERRERRAFQIQLEIQVADDGGDLTAQARRLFVLDEALPQLALQLVDVPIDAFDALLGLEQLRGLLRADAGNTGDVIRRIPHEAQVIAELLRRDAITLPHLIGP